MNGHRGGVAGTRGTRGGRIRRRGARGGTHGYDVDGLRQRRTFAGTERRRAINNAPAVVRRERPDARVGQRPRKIIPTGCRQPHRGRRGGKRRRGRGYVNHMPVGGFASDQQRSRQQRERGKPRRKGKESETHRKEALERPWERARDRRKQKQQIPHPDRRIGSE